jgi:hypothetical protein
LSFSIGAVNNNVAEYHFSPEDISEFSVLAATSVTNKVLLLGDFAGSDIYFLGLSDDIKGELNIYLFLTGSHDMLRLKDSEQHIKRVCYPVGGINWGKNTV